ncbi:hypothetical protein [Kitasatospora sp. NPDC057541]|uniref:hypothetical protein n=1 Tax=unclassified Kitasatospora TaxID=2633591 RepID=UPI00368DCCC1
MIWLAWRQQRAVAAGLLAILAFYAAMAVWEQSTYPGMRGLTSGLSQYFSLFLGFFVGAPAVAREYELGTHRFVWTQTISRRRWYTTRIAVAAAVAVAGVAGLSAAVAWAGQRPEGWSRFTQDPMSQAYFDSHGVTPFAVALFLVALGFTAGTVLQRTLPTMGVVLVAWIALTTAGPALRDRLRDEDLMTGYWSWQLAYGGALLVLAMAISLVGRQRMTRR